jgi:hypothetical protein
MNTNLEEKLISCSLENEKIMEIFWAMERTLAASGSEQAAVTLGFVKDPDTVVAGELLPTITFTLTRFQPNTQTD